MATITINRFDGGMVNDIRDVRENVCQKAQHIDLFTNSHKLIPHYSQEVGDDDAANQQIRNFAFDGATLYGLGTETSVGTNSFIYKVTALTTPTWTDVKNTQREIINANDSDVDNAPFFIYYHKTSALYGAGGGRYFWRYVPGTDTLSNTVFDATSYTTVSNGIVHSKDDILYVGADNKIYKNDNDTGAVFSLALTLPNRFVITSITEYGDFIAIGCRSKGTLSSRVFLWNRDESTVLLSENIDWGGGSLMLLEEIEGHLVGVSFQGINNFNGDTPIDNLGEARTIFRYYNGPSGAIKFHEFTGFGQTPSINAVLYKFKLNQRVLFPATINIGGTPASQVAGEKGIWSITKDGDGFKVTEEYIFLNNTPDNGALYGIFQVGNFLYASYVNNSTHYTDKTNDAITFTQTSTYISTINPKMDEGDRVRNKQLRAFGITTDKLGSGMQVIASYRTDGGSWTTIFTKTSTSPDTDLIGFDKAFAATKGREFEFRLQSTGGAVITSFSYKYDVLSTNV